MEAETRVVWTQREGLGPQKPDEAGGTLPRALEEAGPSRQHLGTSILWDSREHASVLVCSRGGALHGRPGQAGREPPQAPRSSSCPPSHRASLRLASGSSARASTAREHGTPCRGLKPPGPCPHPRCSPAASRLLPPRPHLPAFCPLLRVHGPALAGPQGLAVRDTHRRAAAACPALPCPVGLLQEEGLVSDSGGACWAARRRGAP